MNKTLAKNNGKIGTKRSLKVKSAVSNDVESEPKKRGRKSGVEKSGSLVLDANYEKVMDILDSKSNQLIAPDEVELNIEDGKDTIIKKGKNSRVNVGKLWCQCKDNLFSVHETQSVRKSIWEKQWTPKEDNVYNEMIVFLSEHAF